MRSLVTAVTAALLLGVASVPAMTRAGKPVSSPNITSLPRMAPTPAPSQSAVAVGDQILVRYRKGTTSSDRARIGRAYGLTRLHLSPNGRTDLVVAKGR